MFIHRELRFAVMSVSLAALAGCESLDNVMGALSSEQAAKECGLIPPKSRAKNAVHARRRAYLECKRKVLEEQADPEPRT